MSKAESNIMSGIKGYVDGVSAFMPRSMVSFVKRDGRPMERKPLPDGWTLGVPGQCYINAANAVRRAEICGEPERYLYVEGFAMGRILPVWHAWVLDTEDDKAIEVTWKAEWCSTERIMHYGIPFDSDTHARLTLEHGYHGILELYALKEIEKLGQRAPGRGQVLGGAV